MNARGVTLLELLVVLAIMALIAGMVLPTFGEGVPTSTLKSSARQLASGLRMARTEAVAQKRETFLWLDLRGRRFKVDRDPNATVAQRVAASEHTTRQQNGDTVDEYRQNGKVWMIHIVPKGGGPDETFMDTTGTGRLTRDPRQGPVSPVYFSLYDWN